MREIKFRVWNGGDMVYDVTTGKFGTFYVNPGSKGDGLDEKYAASLTPFTTKYSDQIPVMQYTGSKDIDDKEVYEGDILKFPDDEQPYTVKWLDDEGAWGVMFRDIRATGKAGLARFMKVAGNIYENPELLKDKET